MIKLGAKGIKNLKILHIIFAMVWMSGALGMILITFLANAETGDQLYMKYTAMLIIDNWMIIVGAVATIVLGIIYGIFTNWGFFKHRWITIKWVITIAQALYGTFAYHPWLTENREIVISLKDAAFLNSELMANDFYMQISGFFQFGLLVFAVVISVIKPWRKKKKVSAALV